MTGNNFVTPQTPKSYRYQLKNADGTTAQAVMTGAANGTKIYAMWVCSTDTVARDIQITILRGSRTDLQTTVTIPAGAGNVGIANSGLAAVDMMSDANWPGLAKDRFGNRYFHLESTDTLQVNSVVSLASGKLISVNAIGADF